MKVHLFIISFEGLIQTIHYSGKKKPLTIIEELKMRNSNLKISYEGNFTGWNISFNRVLSLTKFKQIYLK